MISLTKPKNFTPNFEVVSCFLDNEGEILLLHRLSHKSQGNRWGAPAGKMNFGESPSDAVLREIREETSITLTENNLCYFKKVYVAYETVSFIYHMFSTKLAYKVHIKINKDEHDDYLWIRPIKALGLDLVEDMADCIKMYYSL